MSMNCTLTEKLSNCFWQKVWTRNKGLIVVPKNLSSEENISSLVGRNELSGKNSDWWWDLHVPIWQRNTILKSPTEKSRISKTKSEDIKVKGENHTYCSLFHKNYPLWICFSKTDSEPRILYSSSGMLTAVHLSVKDQIFGFHIMTLCLPTQHFW